MVQTERGAYVILASKVKRKIVSAHKRDARKTLEGLEVKFDVYLAIDPTRE
jgi:hypothetical protein